MSSVVAVAVDDPVFAGHYPGFPVLPGVYLIDLADRAARAEVPGRDLRLTQLRRCRFSSPVYPGDEVAVAVTVVPSPAGTVCQVRVSSGDAEVMRATLEYAGQEAR